MASKIQQLQAVLALMRSKDKLETAVEFDRANRATENVRFGGKYSPAGLEEAEREAYRNVVDRFAFGKILGEPGPGAM